MISSLPLTIAPCRRALWSFCGWMVKQAGISEEAPSTGDGPTVCLHPGWLFWKYAAGSERCSGVWDTGGNTGRHQQWMCGPLYLGTKQPPGLPVIQSNCWRSDPHAKIRLSFPLGIIYLLSLISSSCFNALSCLTVICTRCVSPPSARQEGVWRSCMLDPSTWKQRPF